MVYSVYYLPSQLLESTIDGVEWCKRKQGSKNVSVNADIAEWYFEYHYDQINGEVELYISSLEIMRDTVNLGYNARVYNANLGYNASVLPSAGKKTPLHLKFLG